MKLIGRVIATEKNPTTIDTFYFWTKRDFILNPFDVVKVEHVDGSETFAVIEEISHITDAASFLTSYISSDFGDVNVTERTHRVGMNYVKANVVGNTKDIFIPAQNNAKVYLASKDEISYALGLDKINNPLICGYLEMYGGVKDHEKVTLPVPIDSNFLIGPEGAHLNISGISGLAAKTSYGMFLLKALQSKLVNNETDENVAFVVFNVKGQDLLALDLDNEFESDDEREQVEACYEMLGIEPKPFRQVHYLYPYSDKRSLNSYVQQELFEKQKKFGRAFQYKYDYQMDKEGLDLLFANIDDSHQTMDSILSEILREDSDFSRITTWNEFIQRLEELGTAGQTRGSRDITVGSWRKFTRLIKKTIQGNVIFSSPNEEEGETRIADKIAGIKRNDVFVVDVAKLNTDMQAFVFGNTIKELYDLCLGVKDFTENGDAPSKIIIFIDELNKFASSEVPKNSPILRQILDIAERGRSLGVILFGAEQFKSAIHQRVTGNCSTFAYGRTNSIEVARSDYRYIPAVYKSMMTRLKPGEYLIQNPIFRSVLNVKFPKPIYKQFK
ncbi:AAA-like domain protein [Pseudodesulfovibrio hydrargyri]|uniref:AAA-like domain protein n=1 Tax=Pseudodesulfovibrio hydrargyri TaxID=2125990 RepID=A0A1J5N083_9BACT|nr:ATP-binding protein [Pseudodesulfovibrio hydrargyri]OIQ49059.1 AAA-like domain protein [Pseudodesulfovibrio hydrargyri]